MIFLNMQLIRPISTSQLPLVVSSILESTPNLRHASIWFGPSFTSILTQPPHIPMMEESYGGKLFRSRSQQRGIPSRPIEK